MTLRLTEEEYAGLRKRKSKYHNEPVVEDGVRHDSKRELKFYRILRASLRASKIAALGRQVEYILPGGIIYKADFVVHHHDGRIEIMDAKGVRTDTYKLKKRLMASIGREIVEL